MKILESQQLLQVPKSCVHSHESPSTSKLKFATIDGNFYSALKYSSNSLSFSVCTISDTPCWNLGNAKFKSILTTAAATDCFFIPHRGWVDCSWGIPISWLFAGFQLLEALTVIFWGQPAGRSNMLQRRT